MPSWSLIIGFLVIVGLSAAAYVFAPKGENQTYVSLLSALDFQDCAKSKVARTALETTYKQKLTSPGYGEVHSYSVSPVVISCGVSKTEDEEHG